MRKPTDTCLLCKTNHSTKKNSHILPKFLSKKLFGTKNVKRGFQVSSNSTIDKSPKIVQDSPKEDYILCPECEEYFGILESISSDTFINWRKKVASAEFTQKVFSDSFSVFLYNSSNKEAIRLFVYSIFWRTSISNHVMFQNMKISSNIEDSLRETLLSYKATSKGNMLNLLNNPSLISLFPITIITADSFTDETSNILYAPSFYGVYELVIDQFSFCLFRSREEINQDFFKGASNFEINDCRVIVFSNELWSDIIVKPILNALAKRMSENAKKNPK